MGELARQILEAIEEGRYVFSEHADQRIAERRLVHWQVIAATLEGRVTTERPENEPDPVVEIEEVLPDGVACNCVWAWLSQSQTARLVTIHFL